MVKTVKEIVSEIKEIMALRGGLKHVYFVACGGSKAAIFPGLYLLQQMNQLPIRYTLSVGTQRAFS